MHVFSWLLVSRCRLYVRIICFQKNPTGVAPGGGLKIFFGQFWLFWKSCFELWWPNTPSYKKFYKTENVHFFNFLSLVWPQIWSMMFHSASRAKKLMFCFFTFFAIFGNFGYSCIFYHALAGMHAYTKNFLALKMTWLYVIHHLKEKSWAYGLWLAAIGQL